MHMERERGGVGRK
jgi:hypothetical protein